MSPSPPLAGEAELHLARFEPQREDVARLRQQVVRARDVRQRQLPGWHGAPRFSKMAKTVPPSEISTSRMAEGALPFTAACITV